MNEEGINFKSLTSDEYRYYSRKTKKVKATTKPVMQRNTFIDIVNLSNCTVCKVSIVMLILLSFIVVRSQKQSTLQQTAPVTDSVKVAQGDTLHFHAQTAKTKGLL